MKRRSIRLLSFREHTQRRPPYRSSPLQSITSADNSFTAKMRIAKLVMATRERARPLHDYPVQYMTAGSRPDATLPSCPQQASTTMTAMPVPFATGLTRPR